MAELNGPSEDDSRIIRQCLSRIVESAPFQRNKADHPVQFLEFIVGEALAGRQDQIKESAVGVAVFGKRPDWDTQEEATVRRAAGRLRTKLDEYYRRHGGSDDAFEIEIPIGAYVPKFKPRAIDKPDAPPEKEASDPIEFTGKPLPPVADSGDDRKTKGTGLRRAGAGKMWIVAALAFLVAAGSMWRIINSERHRLPSRVEVETDTIIVRDGEGKVLWRRAFPEGLSESEYVGSENLRNKYILADVNHDGRTEIIFSRFPFDASQSTVLFCFSDSGEELWHFQPSGPSVTDSKYQKYTGPYFIKAVEPLLGRKPRIAVSSAPVYPLLQLTQLVILDAATGSKIGTEFWHPGPLVHLKHWDLIGSGEPQLLAAGFDSEFQSAVLMVLDPKNMPRRALTLEPLIKADADLVLGWLLFQPTDAIDTEKVSASTAQDLEVGGNRIYLTVTENIDDRDVRRLLYQLDYHLTVLDVNASVAYMRFYDDLFHRHKVKIDFDQSIKEERTRVLRGGAMVMKPGTTEHQKDTPNDQ